MRTAIYLTSLFIFSGICQLPAQRKPLEKPLECREVANGPYSFATVFTWLDNRRDRLCVVKWVEKGHVTFQATPLVKETLKELDAPDGLLELIGEQPPPPPP